MKDLIAKLHSDSATQILATFSTLEMQLQGFAKSSYEKDLRIAELEAQIAAASAQAVEQQPVAWMTDDGRVASATTKCEAMPSVSQAAFNIPLYAAQPAGTDKLRDDNALMHAAINCGHVIMADRIVLECDPDMPGNALSQLRERLNAAASTALQAPVREVPEVNDAKYSEAEKVREAILSIEVSTSGSKGYAKAWSEGAEHMRDAVVNLFDIMAMQAPAQQWIDVEDRLPEDHQDVLVYHCPSAVPSDKECYWVNECSFYRGRFELPNVSHWMPLPAAPVQEPKP